MKLWIWAWQYLGPPRLAPSVHEILMRNNRQKRQRIILCYTKTKSCKRRENVATFRKIHPNSAERLKSCKLLPAIWFRQVQREERTCSRRAARAPAPPRGPARARREAPAPNQSIRSFRHYCSPLRISCRAWKMLQNVLMYRKRVHTHMCKLYKISYHMWKHTHAY